jgi:hypothetical protein
MGVPTALIINPKQPTVEGEDERPTDEEVQTADAAAGEGTLTQRCVSLPPRHAHSDAGMLAVAAQPGTHLTQLGVTDGDCKA